MRAGDQSRRRSFDCQAVLAARRSHRRLAYYADDEYASDLAMPRFTNDNTRDLSDAQVTELNERYEQSIKWLTPDLPNYNDMCDHIAENVLCAYEVSQRTMGPP
jgi:hypothetical protein